MQFAMSVKFGKDMKMIINTKLIHIDEISNLSYPMLYWGDYTKHLFCANITRYLLLKGRGEIDIQVTKIAIFISIVCVTFKVVNHLKEHDEINNYLYVCLVGNDNMDTPILCTWIGSLGWRHRGEGMGKIQAGQDWSLDALGGKSHRWVFGLKLNLIMVGTNQESLGPLLGDS